MVSVSLTRWLLVSVFLVRKRAGGVASKPDQPPTTCPPPDPTPFSRQFHQPSGVGLNPPMAPYCDTFSHAKSYSYRQFSTEDECLRSSPRPFAKQSPANWETAPRHGCVAAGAVVLSRYPNDAPAEQRCAKTLASTAVTIGHRLRHYPDCLYQTLSC